MARIELKDLDFIYPGVTDPTLSKLNLTIQDGEAHALLGASGAGKTTLLNLLSGLLHPTRGQVLFDGSDVSAQPGRERAVAQVFQFPVLYESMTVAENLAFPLRTRGYAEAQIKERVAYIAAELELEARLDARSKALSLFEKQLTAVGKALVRPDVPLVLLDEPLTAVEPRVKWRLRQTLKKVQADLDVTMVYVTHDQTEALTFADRVSLLTVDGIVQTGTPEAVYQSPASEFVGHFVGSPGMNFVPAALLPVDGERAGFRPEWAALEADGQIAGAVRRVRLLGTRSGVAEGLTTVDTVHGDITVRGPVTASEGDRVHVRVNRYVAFAETRQIGSGELT